MQNQDDGLSILTGFVSGIEKGIANKHGKSDFAK